MTACQSRCSPFVFSNFDHGPWPFGIEPVENHLRLDLSVVGVGHALEEVHDEALVQIRAAAGVENVTVKQHVPVDQRINRNCLILKHLLISPRLVRLDGRQSFPESY